MRPKEKGIRLDGNSWSWFLEGFVGEARDRWRAALHSLPATIGRVAGEADLQVPSPTVSSRHALAFLNGDALWLRDLGSRNGTYVNGRRIVDDARIEAGDHVQLGELELRVGVRSAGGLGTDSMSGLNLSSFLADRAVALQEMMDGGEIMPHFQPVVRIDEGDSIGYELLSRGRLDGSAATPAELFFLAQRLGAEVRLSRILRERGLDAAQGLDGEAWIFVNTHPAELEEPDTLLRSLGELARRIPNLRLVLEIHEAAATDLKALKRLRSGLHDLGMRLAFDDFGTGESRLRELATAPPDYLKFDMGWIRGLHRASHRKRMLTALIGTAGDLGITTVAEGVEDPRELNACREVRFGLAQGFFLGVPQPVDGLSADADCAALTPEAAES